MKVVINYSIDEYVERGDQNTKGLLAGHHPLMADIRAYYEFFATKLWSDGQHIPEIPMFLSTNSFMLWTSAIRTAMSGHEMAVYPLLRTSLESACYALLICRKPELGPIWAGRHDGEVQLKAARKVFRTAVGDVVEDVVGKDPALGSFVSQLYEASIDLGAHPNALGIMRHVQATDPTAEQTRYDLGSIYPGNSFQVFRALAAGIEFGLGNAFLLAKCLPIISETVGEGLVDLKKRRNSLASDEECDEIGNVARKV